MRKTAGSFMTLPIQATARGGRDGDRGSVLARPVVFMMSPALPKMLVVLAIGLAASACQSVSEEQCQSADWQQVGYGDGLQGAPIEQLEVHREACVRHGVAPQREQYLRGREQGLVLYCEPDSGFHRGREGMAYFGVCSSAQEAEFLHAYRQGRLLGDHERELTALRGIKRSLESEIRNIDKRSDNRFFADLSRGQRPGSMDLILLAESMEKEKLALQQRVIQVTREIEDLVLRIESLISSSAW